jgi:hypothetical protein
MQQLAQCLRLTNAFKAAGFPDPTDFESIYDQLVSTGSNPSLLAEVETRVQFYFQAMVLPSQVTLYDRLLLSLRDTDLVATFNWDPFLAKAYARNRAVQRLPQIVFLHGNVEVAVCLRDRVKGFRGQVCHRCGAVLQPTKLLYPVRSKDYKSDPFIVGEWAVLEDFLKRAYMLTIFGYGAPKTDAAAVDLLSDEWTGNPRFELGQVNLIDIRPKKQLEETWEPFLCRSHYGIYRRLWGTWLQRHPRRSCEAVAWATLQMAPWKNNPMPRHKSLAKLQQCIDPLLAEEQAGKFSGNPCAKL